MAAAFHIDRLTEPMSEAWHRPLSLKESAYVALVLFALGTAYCQLYCLIAFQAMHGATMPLWLSMLRSAVETVPAFIAFELSKRVLSRHSGMRGIGAVALLLVSGAAMSVATIVAFKLLFEGSAMPIRLLIADRLPGLTITALAVAWASRLANTPDQPSTDEQKLATNLPPANMIDWVQAAGNYVEIHFGGRVVMLRMTLREAAAILPRDGFVRIHRSTIVNRTRIAGWDGNGQPRRVQLVDGRSLKVGEAYRGNLSP